MDVANFLLLSCLGLAITAQDCPRPTPGPNMHFKGTPPQTFPDGTKVSFSCDVGYSPAGGSPSITCSAGSWSAPTLKCDRKSCGSAGGVANGQVNYLPDTLFGDKAVVECDTGYRVVGRNEIYCTFNGWSGILPVCEVVKCDSPPEIVNGAFSPINEEYSYTDVVKYSCNKDSTLSGSKSRTCSEDGTFKPDPPTCVMVQCEDPAVGPREWVGGARPPYKFSSTVTLGCKSGHTLKGDRTQTCDINSKWSPGLPACELSITTAQYCSRPRPEPNMALKDSDTPPQTFPDGSKVSFACDVGYTPAGESTCTAGSWSPVTLKCEMVKCDSPPEIVNGAFSPISDEYSYRDVVQYSCNRDLTLRGSRSRTCSEDGTFKPDPPTCVGVQCEDPVVGLLEWVGGARPPYKFSSTVTLGCKSGYIMRGDRTQTCDINSKWSPGLPTCEQT